MSGKDAFVHDFLSALRLLEYVLIGDGQISVKIMNN